MKKLTIYEVYVEMQDQAQCNRMKQLCVDNGLPIEPYFFMLNEQWNIFEFTEIPFKHFGLWTSNNNNTKVTEQEFIELLKNK